MDIFNTILYIIQIILFIIAIIQLKKDIDERETSKKIEQLKFFLQKLEKLKNSKIYEELNKDKKKI